MKINRKEIKKKSHINLKKNLFMSIIVIFLFSLVINDNYLFSTQLTSQSKEALEIHELIYDKKTKEIKLNKLNEENKKENNEKFKGVLEPIVSRLGISTSPLYNFSYSLKMIYYDHKINKGIYSLFIAFLSFLLYFLVKIILDIGKNRFFLESRIYHKTNIFRILFPYKIKGTFNLSKILFFKRLYQTLWSITIIGGLIKMYEYKMIPYILAENPKITRKEAFKLSKEMMDGYKWEAFMVDVSLLGWIILGLATLGISNLIYFNAYKEYIYAELYCEIRNKTKNKLTYSKLLNDKYLFDEKTKLDIYPDDKLQMPIKRLKVNPNYDQNYSIRNCILFFFTASFIGYSWEVFLHIVREGRFVNRGTMFGPWLPIYGFGVILILALLKPIRKKPLLFFLSCMLLAGIVEYSTSWVLEMLVHKKWWDYTGYFLNLNGRICLEGLLVFGFGGAIITYFFAPLLNAIFNTIKQRTILIVCFLLLSLFGIDAVYSYKHPNTGSGITDI